MMSDKRLIEESFPVKEVSVESAKEKSIRHGHIATLHIWWARRPLAASRTTAYAALIQPPQNDEEWQKQRNFIIDLAKWENTNNPKFIDKARREILKASGGIPPKVLDPFGGGGSIPLEALRLGCETYSNDYNPVAVILQKCTLEYAQKYGHREQKKDGSLDNEENPLYYYVKKWGDWVLAEAKKEFDQFYLSDPDGSIPVGYIWARTIPCQNPTCGAIIPLMRQFWLAKTSRKKVSLYPEICDNHINFRIVGDGYDAMPDGFNPENGFGIKSVISCPVCGSTIDSKTIHKLFQEGKSSNRIISVVSTQKNKSGKKYRIANKMDEEIFASASVFLKAKAKILSSQWGQNPIPDEPMNIQNRNTIAGRGFGITTWGDLFNDRQKLAIICLIDAIKKANLELTNIKIIDDEFKRAIITYLALAVDRLADYNSTICRWANNGEYIGNTFTRQAIPMVFDYFELYPDSHSTGDWNSALEWILRVIETCSKIKSDSIKITNQSATNLPYADNYFDAVFTDPPYYDNVNYAELSDFFYVWLKRSVGEFYPDYFITPLTPKTNEIIQDSSTNKDKQFFEDNISKSFKEIDRILKINGIAVIVYAHKSTEGWETLINSILDSGLVITEAWPIRTEMQTRFVAKESAALASSIYIIARKMERQPTGFFNNVKEELKTHLNKKLDRLWNEGISGADFFIAAIGSAIEVFGKYEQVMDYEGNIVRADRLLIDVRKIATDYAVKKILQNGFAGEISDHARLYVLWRWNYGEAKVPFDEARKLGQSCGIDVAQEFSHSGFIRKDKEFVILFGPQDRKLDDLEGSKDLIDVLHQVLLLWEKSKRDEMIRVLRTTMFGKSEAFYRVAQAISETLPNESKEKKLLDGFLAGRERMSEEVKKEAKQVRLDV